jgi:hypothetical protein
MFEIYQTPRLGYRGKGNKMTTIFIGSFPKNVIVQKAELTRIDLEKKTVDFLVTGCYSSFNTIKWILTGVVEKVSDKKLVSLQKNKSWATDF